MLQHGPLRSAPAPQLPNASSFPRATSGPSQLTSQYLAHLVRHSLNHGQLKDLAVGHLATWLKRGSPTFLSHSSGPVFASCGRQGETLALSGTLGGSMQTLSLASWLPLLFEYWNKSAVSSYIGPRLLKPKLRVQNMASGAHQPSGHASSHTHTTHGASYLTYRTCCV